MKVFEKAVRHALIDRDLKMSDLADYFGLSVSYVYDIIRGNRKSAEQRAKICEFLQIEDGGDADEDDSE